MKYFFLAIFSLIIVQPGNSQTGGLGYVQSIEAKAKAMLEKEKKIKSLEAEIASSEADYNKRVQKLKDEIAALTKEGTSIINDMKVGAKCSECNNWKTDIEKSGRETFQQHLGRVGGRSYPATTGEIESKRQEYKERIALKKVALQRLEKESPVAKIKNEIESLKKQLTDDCNSITKLSKDYETTVYKNAEQKHKNWFTDIMQTLAQQHILEDKIAIAKRQLTNAENKYRTALAAMKARHKSELEKKQKGLTEEKALNTKKIADENAAFNQQIQPINNEIGNLQKRIAANRQQLNTEKDSTAKIVIAQQIAADQAALDNKLSDKESITRAHEKQIKLYKFKISEAEDELWNIQKGLTVLQTTQSSELNTLNSDYESKKTSLNSTITNSTEALAKISPEVQGKKNSYKQKNIQYVDEIIAECNRMLIAAQPVNCFVHNEIRFKVAQNYNTQESCVLTLTSTATNNRSFSSTAVGCVAKFPAYVSKYKTFASGLNDDEKEAIKQTTYTSWYDEILKK